MMKAASLIVVLVVLSIMSYAGNYADKKCSEKYEGRTLYVGEKGGCYYITVKNGKREKNYVDRSLCKGCN